MAWNDFNQGKSIGTRGSENGLVLRDEEHESGARVTFEQGGYTAPFSITCGIYGWMMHTCFFSIQHDAEVAFGVIKDELVEILKIIPFDSDPDMENKTNEVIQEIGRFVNRHR
jgi:hypothetical protein